MVYQLRETEPETFHFPNDEGPDVAELRCKLKKIHEQRENKRDPFIWFADFCTVLVLSPVLIPVAIVFGIIHLIRRRHES